MFPFKFNKGNLSAESETALYYAQYKGDWNHSYFLAESTIQESVSKQNFYACARARKSNVAATFRSHSV